MSVRHALLALLSEGPKYGLQLREEFESGTGEVWPLNVGQVYTTLQRLERDGLVESDDTTEVGPQKGFRITPAGAEELAAWLRTPPDLSSPPRDELVIKVLVALRIPDVDVHEVLQVHRRYLVELMQQWTHLKEDEAELRPQPRAGGGRRTVPARLGHPMARLRRRPTQARRRRRGHRGPGCPPACTPASAEHSAPNGSTQMRYTHNNLRPTTGTRCLARLQHDGAPRRP